MTTTAIESQIPLDSITHISAVLGRSEVLFEAGDMGVLLKLPKNSDGGLAGENGSLIERPYTIGRWADTDLDVGESGILQLSRNRSREQLVDRRDLVIERRPMRIGRQ